MAVRKDPEFTGFRGRYWTAAAWPNNGEVADSGGAGGQARRRGPQADSSGAVFKTRQHRQSLKTLDLQLLPREETAPSELQLRREKFALYEKHCSEVGPGLFVGGEAVAKSWEILSRSGITHVVNCVGFIYPDYHKDRLSYKTLRLQDTPSEDLTSVLYDVFDFFEAARSVSGNVFVHCSQGVSRSATLVIAYLMWRWDKPYDEVFAAVKAKRGVANPNIGFTCQLLQWDKRRRAQDFFRVYRIAPHSAADAALLVPKLIGETEAGMLDPRWSFLVHTPTELHIWHGSRCTPAMQAAADRVAKQLHKFEDACSSPLLAQEGQESSEFWAALQGSSGWSRSKVAEVESYNADFESCAHAPDDPPQQKQPRI